MTESWFGRCAVPSAAALRLAVVPATTRVATASNFVSALIDTPRSSFPPDFLGGPRRGCQRRSASVPNDSGAEDPAQRILGVTSKAAASPHGLGGVRP